MSIESCLAENLSHYLELTEDDRRRLARFEETEKSFDKQAEIYSVGEECNQLYAVKKGWLYSYVDFADGRRQIVKIHTPGDLIGFSDLAYDKATTSLRTCSDVTVCPFPKHYLDDVLKESPRLSAVLLTVSVRDQVILVDTLRAMGRMSARERVAYFLLDILARLRVMGGRQLTSFQLPLSQTEIGDVIGLTNVYVSKTLGRLEDAGRIRRTGNHVEILEEDELRQLADFTDRYASLDTSWFPSARC